MSPKAYSYIRFSSPEQEKGDSLRRQVEEAEKYAKEHNLELDDSVRLVDKGLSAYNGAHRDRGALGEFLKLVKKGDIEKGSVLIVENLDRLSREEVLDALNQFTSIIKAGIKLVTLHDQQEYDQESINNNWAQLIISIAYMARAHEESSTKSKRLKSAWQHKRECAVNGQGILTSMIPYWLKIENGEFVLITEICDVIKLVFEKKLEGKGAAVIARELNLDPYIWKPPKSNRNKSGGWRDSYINKILRNKAVIGEYQPCTIIKDKKRIREKVGDPIPNYYPAVIDKDTFYQVQAQLKERSVIIGRAGGRTGKASNLFVHVVKCGLCGAPMHFIDKGNPPRGNKYLQCDGNRRFKNCPTKLIPYSEFEKLFFDNFEELDISELMPNKDDIEIQIDELTRKLTADNYRINEIDEEVENLADSIAKTKDGRVRERLERRLSIAFDEREKLQSEIHDLQNKIVQLKSEKEELQNQINKTKEVYTLLNSVKDEAEQRNLRLKLRQQIQSMIEWVKIYPLLEPYQEYEETDEEGVIRYMRSKYIDKVKIKFRGSRNLRVFYLKGYAVGVDDE